MKRLILISLLIICASAASTTKPKNKPRNGLQGRYDVPPGAQLPSNGNSNSADENVERMSMTSSPSPINLSMLSDVLTGTNSNAFTDEGTRTPSDYGHGGTNYRPNRYPPEYNQQGARRPNPNASDDWIPAGGGTPQPSQPSPSNLNQPNPSNPATPSGPSRSTNEGITSPGRDNNTPPGRESNTPPGRDSNAPPGRDSNAPPGRDSNAPPERDSNNEINDNVNEGDESCICVPYYQCQDGNIITDGAGLIDQRKRKAETPLNKRLAGPSCGEFHVCCTEPERKPLNDAYPHRCGIRNPNGINRRALSTNQQGEAEFGEWPATATILKPDQSNALYFQSGAVLISDQHVLTTAHTIQNLEPQTLIVRLGEWDVSNTNEFLPHADYKVANVKIHENFVPTNLRNDIAIITLAEKVRFAPNIDTICLPRENEQYGDQQCVVTGWGKKDYRGGSYSNIMKKVGLPLVPHEQCQAALRKTRLGIRFRLHKSFMCAGGEASKDSCKGDGGGPLYCYRPDGTYALTGLVSWGIDCGTEGVPGVYTNVKEYLGFIQQNIGRDLRSLQGN